MWDWLSRIPSSSSVVSSCATSSSVSQLPVMTTSCLSPRGLRWRAHHVRLTPVNCAPDGGLCDDAQVGQEVGPLAGECCSQLIDLNGEVEDGEREDGDHGDLADPHGHGHVSVADRRHGDDSEPACAVKGRVSPQNGAVGTQGA